MHGRVKVKAPKEIQAEREREEQALAKKFKEDLDKAWDKRRAKCYDEDALRITGRILLQNADYQTIWNFRREIILHWKENGLPEKAEPLLADVIPKETSTNVTETSTDETETVADGLNLTSAEVQLTDVTVNCETVISNSNQNAVNTEEEEKPVENVCDMEKVYMDELKFSSSCLIKHPKSYATWYHRRCIIQAMKNPPFKEEIQACNHFLDLDERNFHCWDYRRFICTYGKIDRQNELQFTQKKICQNFSNFSSFYYRSSLLTLSHNEGILDINDYWDSDYETISNAIFVDPNDQSPWFYHKWLLAADQFINYQNPAPETLLHKIMFEKSNGYLIYQFYQPIREPPFDSMSIVTKDGQASSLNDIVWKKIQPISSYLWYHQIDNFETIDVISFQYSEKRYTVDLPELDDKANLKVNVISPLPVIKTLNAKSKLDSNKLNNLKLLLEIEPDNKWINLTMSLITGEPDENVFDKLIDIDPLRRNYYKDQRSKQITQKKLEDYQLGSELILSKLNLTCLYFINHLTHLRFLDLSNNDFVKISASFNTLIVLETLVLDENRIGMVDSEFTMLSLKKLSLKNNHISKCNCLEPIKNCPSLKVLDLTDNPINDEEGSPLPVNIQIIH